MSASTLPVGSSSPQDEATELTTEEKRAILSRVFPLLVNRMSMFVGKPVRLVWDPTIRTASTDCMAEVRMAPWFFLQGQDRVGYGTSTHESGHIRWSPQGAELMGRARRAGGETRQNIMNIILDRKDDILTAEDAPGYAPELRDRLLYICTMSLRPLIRLRCPDLSEEQVTDLLHTWKPGDVWQDFFFAAKWHKRPRIKRTHKAMKYLTRRRLLGASGAELLWIAERIHDILGEPEGRDDIKQRRERQEAERLFNQLCLIAMMVELGKDGRGDGGAQGDEEALDPDLKAELESTLAKAGLDSKTRQILQGIAKLYVASARSVGLQQLIKRMQTEVVYMGPISVGTVDSIQRHKVDSDPRFASENQRLRQEIDAYIQPLVQRLRRVDSPSVYTLYGQEEGDLDFDEISSIALGFPGVYEEEVVEREVDVEIHLAIDTSGSMYGEKLERAKQIAKLFCEAIDALGEGASGRVWCFDDSGVYDYGPPNPNSGFVAHETGMGNSDTHMLQIVGPELARSEHKRKVLLTLCDDGPDNIEQVRRLTDMLMARGILAVHLMVGVHGTPSIYPIELIYTSMEECLDQFGELIETIITHVR